MRKAPREGSRVRGNQGNKGVRDGVSDGRSKSNKKRRDRVR